MQQKMPWISPTRPVAWPVHATAQHHTVISNGQPACPSCPSPSQAGRRAVDGCVGRRWPSRVWFPGGSLACLCLVLVQVPGSGSPAGTVHLPRPDPDRRVLSWLLLLLLKTVGEGGTQQQERGGGRKDRRGGWTRGASAQVLRTVPCHPMLCCVVLCCYQRRLTGCWVH